MVAYTHLPNDSLILFVFTIYSGNFDLLNTDVDEDKVSVWLEKRIDARKGSTVWRSEEDHDEDTFSISVDPNGKFAFCIRVDKTVDEDDYEGDVVQVGFNLRVSPAAPRTLEDGVPGPDAEWAMELLQSANFVEVDWQNMIDHFNYMRSREATHTALMHQIRDRVLGWTVVEAILVITMAIGQILYWKRFFEKRRYL